MTKILAFAGSNSSQSINEIFVKYVANQIDKEVDVIDIAQYEIPLYGIDYERNHGIPQATKQLNEKLNQYDVLVISANEHNGTVSAFFKNHIDWLSRYDRDFLKNKKLFLLSTSPGRGGAKMSLAYLSEILPRFGAEIVSSFALASFGHHFSKEEGITDDAQRQDFQKALDTFVKAIQ